MNWNLSAGQNETYVTILLQLIEEVTVFFLSDFVAKKGKARKDMAEKWTDGLSPSVFNT